MNKKIRKVAKRAGFVFWGKEHYGPGPKHIDWSCVYDAEIDEFAHLLIEKCAKLADKGEDIRKHFHLQKGE